MEGDEQNLGASADADRAVVNGACSQAPPQAASIPSADKVLLTGMGPSSRGGWEMGFADGEENGVLHIIAAGLANMMRLDSDKPLNCIEMDVQPAGQPMLRLTMQRSGGKSPTALKNEATRLLRVALRAIESGRSEPLFIARDAIRNWLDNDPAQAMETRSAETTGSAPKG